MSDHSKLIAEIDDALTVWPPSFAVGAAQLSIGGLLVRARAALAALAEAHGVNCPNCGKWIDEQVYDAARKG